MHRALIVICTRLESRRLPGKALLRIAGVPALEHILNRLRGCGLPIALACPEGQTPDFFDLSKRYGTLLYGGHDASPLHRMATVLAQWPARFIIRVTHDDILLDQRAMLDLLAKCEADGAGYGISPSIVDGAGIEVIFADVLRAASILRTEPTEYISYFVKDGGGKIVRMDPRPEVRRKYRLTMDYPEDAQVLEAVLRAVGANASLDKVVEYVDDHQFLLEHNRLPELSIYTCAFNAHGTIEAAVQSAKGIVYPRKEHVIVDDGSTDETLTSILRCLGRGDQRLVVNTKNMGLASSSNIALSEAKGRYAMRLDADDSIDPDGWEVAWQEISSKLSAGAQAVYPAFYIRGVDGRRHAKVQDPRVHHHAGGAVFNRAFLNELRFKDGIRHWDGLELYRRLREVGARIEYCDTPTWAYSQRAGSMSRSEPAERARLKEELER